MKEVREKLFDAAGVLKGTKGVEGGGKGDFY